MGTLSGASVRWFSFSIITLLLLSCSHVDKKLGCNDVFQRIEGPGAPAGLKIGLLSDSHLQTDKSLGHVAMMKGKLSDSVVDVSIRPAALDHYAEYLLRYHLGELTARHKVEMILYLGDGANNGCADEIKKVLSILGSYREEYKTPVFYIIGNHDYLGAGNTNLYSDRKKLCDDKVRNINNNEYNKPLTKFEVMRALSEFNAANSKYSTALQYADNFDPEGHKTACIVNKPPVQTELNIFGVESRDGGYETQHVKKGCYLSGRVIIKDKGIEILLADSSDYSGNGDKLNVLHKEYFGAYGWVSTGDAAQTAADDKSQIGWFAKTKDDNNKPKIRIIATHYDKASGGIGGRDLINNNFCRLMDGGAKTYWLSAHTHTFLPMAETKRVKCNDGKSTYKVSSLNIGSATDYPSHAVVLALDGEKAAVSTTSMPDAICRAVFDRIDHQPESDSPRFEELNVESQHGEAIFGMTRDYRKLLWSQDDTVNAYINQDRLVDYLLKDDELRAAVEKVNGGMQPDGIIKACMANQASKKEKKWESNDKLGCNNDNKDKGK